MAAIMKETSGTMNVSELHMLPIGAIRVDHSRNISRGGVTPWIKQYQVRRLRESMSDLKRMLEPVGVRQLAAPIPRPEAERAADPSGVCEHTYELVYGFRRFVAAKDLGWTDIPCVLLGFLSDEEARLLNITENEVRADATDYDDAMVYAMLLREKDMTCTDLARQLSTSGRRIEMLVGIANRCPPELLEIWRCSPGPEHLTILRRISDIRGESPEATRRMMFDAWAAYEASLDPTAAPRAEARPRSPSVPRSMNRREIDALRATIDCSTEVRDLSGWRPLTDAERSTAHALLRLVAEPKVNNTPLR